MARRWTPRRFVRLRRIRVAICAVAVALASTVAFGVAARKTIALSINGDTQTVTTYAMSVTRLLEERGVDVKSHDLVQSTSGDILSNHDVVTVNSAYQTTISIDGQRVPFWTVATSASQLLGFFQQNENEAAKVTVESRIDAAGSLPFGATDVLPSAMTVTGPDSLMTRPPVSWL